MLHRHLYDEGFSPSVIDAVIPRGKRAAREALRDAIINDPSLLEPFRRVCRHHVHGPHTQLYHYWSDARGTGAWNRDVSALSGPFG